MNSSIIKKMFNMSIFCLLIATAYSRPIYTRSCKHYPLREMEAECISCGNDKCPGSPETRASILKQFKQFNYCVTSETVVIRIGGVGLSATENEVKFAKPSDGNIGCKDPEDMKFFFYKYQFTINGTEMMSLVPVGSPDLIVTWGPVDVGSGDINETITYELKTENITKVFEMMSSNTTEYDTNWRFQMDYSESLFAVKMLTEEGDLAVTYHDEDTILTNKISGVSQGDEDPKYQVFAICNDCP